MLTAGGRIADRLEPLAVDEHITWTATGAFSARIGEHVARCTELPANITDLLLIPGDFLGLVEQTLCVRSLFGGQRPVLSIGLFEQFLGLSCEAYCA